MGWGTSVWRPVRGTTAILGHLRVPLPSLTSRTAPGCPLGGDGLGDVCEQWSGHKPTPGQTQTAPVLVVIPPLPQARLVQEWRSSCRNGFQNLWLFFCAGCEQARGSGCSPEGHIPPTCSDKELRELCTCKWLCSSSRAQGSVC